MWWLPVLGLLIGLMLGATAGWNEGKLIDRAIMGLVGLTTALPTLIAGMIIIFALDISRIDFGDDFLADPDRIPVGAVSDDFVQVDLHERSRGGGHDSPLEVPTRIMYALIAPFARCVAPRKARLTRTPTRWRRCGSVPRTSVML